MSGNPPIAVALPRSSLCRPRYHQPCHASSPVPPLPFRPRTIRTGPINDYYTGQTTGTIQAYVQSTDDDTIIIGADRFEQEVLRCGRKSGEEDEGKGEGG